jgi:hypothetical protein
MITRSIDNCLRGRFHALDLERNGSDLPLTFDGGKLPLTYLETYNFLVTPTQVLIRDVTNSQYYDVLHANSELTVTLDNTIVGKVKKGQPAVVGDNMNKQQSPAPLCYIDTNGTLNSVVVSDPVWSDSVMGFAAEGKPDTYAQGFVQGGSASHGNLFLRRDGQWGQPSVHTGSVADTFLSLHDTPLEYTGQADRYLRVSYAEGGSIVFDSIDTSKVPEAPANLYYTTERVEAKIAEKAADRSLSSLAVVGTVTANDFLCDSDRRLKTDVQSLKPTEALNRILKLHPTTYIFKGNSKRRSGLISQEVREVLPDLVDDTGATQRVNYLDIIAYLVGSVQALEVEVRELRQSISVS